jgi:D-glycero-beta-D-manno-heptose 1-phosphate adenylyltransferase
MSCRDPQSKVLPKGLLLERFGRPRDLRLVFTNGVFDMVHRGHVSYLASARGLGDALVVGVNTDASARRLVKGPGRPLNGQRDRALVVAALESVDAVCLFDEDTPRELVAELLPDVLVKGGDYRLEQVAGRAEVEAAGGHVVLMPFVEGYSTTDLVRRIREGEET